MVVNFLREGSIMAELPEIEMTEEEQEATFAWTRTPEGIARVKELIAKSEASGPAREVDAEDLRGRAIEHAKSRAHKAA